MREICILFLLFLLSGLSQPFSLDIGPFGCLGVRASLYFLLFVLGSAEQVKIIRQ